MLKCLRSKIFGEKASNKRRRLDEEEDDDDGDDRDDKNDAGKKKEKEVGDDGDGNGKNRAGSSSSSTGDSGVDQRGPSDDDDEDDDDRNDVGNSKSIQSPIGVPRNGVTNSGNAVSLIRNDATGAGDVILASSSTPLPSDAFDDRRCVHLHHHRHHCVLDTRGGVVRGVSGVGVASRSGCCPLDPGNCFDFINAGPSGLNGDGFGVNGLNAGGSIVSASSSLATSFPTLPPPKRKRPNRVIEESEDWCETDANWKDIQYTWTINSFSKCQDELGNYVTSPEFPSSLNGHSHRMLHGDEEDLAFHLKVHLKGENDDSEHLAVYIVCKGPEEVLASFELSIIVDGKKLNLRDSKKVCQFAEEQHPAWGFKKFIQFEELQNEEKGYLKGDRLKLHCEVKYVVAKNLRPVHTSKGKATFKPENRVEEGMERLDVDQLWRDRKLYSDVTIVCQEHEIPANRVLLATRSEVFRAMFAHSTLEASSGRIEITDVDAVVFEQLLAYIYTGFSPNVDALAEELLIAANKYALEELKTDCVRVLESHLSMDNVLEMLKLGDRHEASKLKEAAINFLVNRPDVFTDKSFKTNWYKFKEAHPELTTETVKLLLCDIRQGTPSS